jgi:hypothetical protein
MTTSLVGKAWASEFSGVVVIPMHPMTVELRAEAWNRAAHRAMMMMDQQSTHIIDTLSDDAATPEVFNQ